MCKYYKSAETKQHFQRLYTGINDKTKSAKIVQIKRDKTCVQC